MFLRSLFLQVVLGVVAVKNLVFPLPFYAAISAPRCSAGRLEKINSCFFKTVPLCFVPDRYAVSILCGMKASISAPAGCRSG